jgi:hypothetical protein
MRIKVSKYGAITHITIGFNAEYIVQIEPFIYFILFLTLEARASYHNIVPHHTTKNVFNFQWDEELDL